jgi:hypothetical protein
MEANGDFLCFHSNSCDVTRMAHAARTCTRPTLAGSVSIGPTNRGVGEKEMAARAGDASRLRLQEEEEDVY